MKLNQKLLSQMRTATRAMLGNKPKPSANALVEQTLRNAAAVQQAMQGHGQLKHDAMPVSAQSLAEAMRGAEQFVPDMLAKLGRAGDAATLFGGAPEVAHPVLPGTFSDHSFTNAAGTRRYKLYVPASYTGEQAAPLVVMLHGCTQDPDDFAAGTQMNTLAEELQCLVIYPAQSMQANSSRCWNWFQGTDQQRDRGEPSIIAGITREVMTHYRVNKDQVYVAGLSAGGAMAAIMGTLYPELYAAVGVHSGLPFASASDLPSALSAMKGEFRRQHVPGRPMPIIVFHGDKDTTVHPVNGDAVIAQGALHVSKEIAIEPGRVPDGHAYTRTLHQRADGVVHAEHWLIHGAGHAWSGGSAHGSYTDGRGPDASREMMRFFRTKR
jgi:poly(hydroxyalkanoate) depolymerase family esterase